MRLRSQHILAGTRGFARADFAAAHPEIVEGLARGIEAARISFATSETADVAAVVAKAFEIVPADVVDMLATYGW